MLVTFYLEWHFANWFKPQYPSTCTYTVFSWNIVCKCLIAELVPVYLLCMQLHWWVQVIVAVLDVTNSSLVHAEFRRKVVKRRNIPLPHEYLWYDNGIVINTHFSVFNILSELRTALQVERVFPVFYWVEVYTVKMFLCTSCPWVIISWWHIHSYSTSVLLLLVSYSTVYQLPVACCAWQVFHTTQNPMRCIKILFLHAFCDGWNWTCTYCTVYLFTCHEIGFLVHQHEGLSITLHIFCYGWWNMNSWCWKYVIHCDRCTVSAMDALGTVWNDVHCCTCAVWVTPDLSKR